jgi:hypothetical protein
MYFDGLCYPKLARILIQSEMSHFNATAKNMIMEYNSFYYYFFITDDPSFSHVTAKTAEALTLYSSPTSRSHTSVVELALVT